MNLLKRYLGIVWMLLAPVAMYYLLSTAWQEISKKPLIDTRIQWTVFGIVFLPIAVGLFIFGYFAFKGEYDHLPESSAELED